MLDEDTSRHMVGVLRKEKGETILLTDGKGSKATAVIKDDNRKKCRVIIENIQQEKTRERKIAIGISLIKNSSRFEWFLEKATEIGVSEIIPLICERTEKEKFRYDRMNHILVSAMLQSQQVWLPRLHEPTRFENILTSESELKLIAHCLPGERASLNKINLNTYSSIIMLVGPEGDFTSSEIDKALQNGFQPVVLGNTRLRTETAGIVAAALLITNE